MKNYKIIEFKINGNIASGIIRGLIYRVSFDSIPTESMAKRALRQAAEYNN